MSHQKRYENVVVTPKERSTTEIIAEVPAELVPEYRAKAIEHFNSRLDIPGFRAGHIPEKTVIERVGEAALLEEAAELAIRDIYPAILAEHKIAAIGRPEAKVTKLAIGNPICFTITTAVLPEIALPDYRAIAQKAKSGKEPVVVEEKEVEEALLQIRKALAARDPQSTTEEKKQAEGDMAPKEPEPVELTDEIVRTIGDFTSVKDFTEKLHAQLKREKEQRAAEKLRADIAAGLTDAAKTTLPDILVENEIDKMLARFRDHAKRMDVSFEDYLAHIKKTEDELRAEWRPDAEKQALLQLLLNKIAEAEELRPDADETERHAEIVRKQAKDADPDSVRVYVEGVLTNEAVFKLLEGV